MQYAIEIKNLCKQYPKFALQSVSFTLPMGYIMGFIGENGAGKTTVMKSWYVQTAEWFCCSDRMPQRKMQR